MELKLDEIICFSTWRMANQDGVAARSGIDGYKDMSDKEKDVTRSMRKLFSMSVDRFNKQRKIYHKLVCNNLYKNLDPLTQICCLYSCYCVGEVEKETDDNWISDLEWKWVQDYIIHQSFIDYNDLIVNGGIKPSCIEYNDLRNKIIFDESWDFARRITDPKLLDDNSPELKQLFEDKKNGVLGSKYINPILTKFFNYYENKKMHIEWESAYKALKRNYRELKKLFGVFDIKAIDGIYKELKFNITEEKKKIIEETKRLKRLNKESVKSLEREKKEEEKKKAKNLLNREHYFKTAYGITYCKYCGELKKIPSETVDCRREEGHKYRSIKCETWRRRAMCSVCGKNTLEISQERVDFKAKLLEKYPFDERCDAAINDPFNNKPMPWEDEIYKCGG